MKEYNKAAKTARPYRTPACPGRRRPKAATAPLQTCTIKRDGEAPLVVQTSTPRILEPATPGMRSMIAALLVETLAVRRAA